MDYMDAWWTITGDDWPVPEQHLAAFARQVMAQAWDQGYLSGSLGERAVTRTNPYK